MRKPNELDLLIYGSTIILILAADRIPAKIMRYLLMIIGLAAGALLMALVALLLFKPRK